MYLDRTFAERKLSQKVKSPNVLSVRSLLKQNETTVQQTTKSVRNYQHSVRLSVASWQGGQRGQLPHHKF